MGGFATDAALSAKGLTAANYQDHYMAWLLNCLKLDYRAIILKKKNNPGVLKAPGLFVYFSDRLVGLSVLGWGNTFVLLEKAYEMLRILESQRISNLSNCSIGVEQVFFRRLKHF